MGQISHIEDVDTKSGELPSAISSDSVIAFIQCLSKQFFLADQPVPLKSELLIV